MNGVIHGTPETGLGKATASRIADIVATTKSGGWSTSRTNYLWELVCERLTGVPTESYVSPAMKLGLEKEAEAKAVYARECRVDIEEIGYCDHPTIANSGATPDGAVGKYGLVQIKCPLTATHARAYFGGTIPGEYVTQMQWEMACRPERRWCDYVSFDPRLPGPEYDEDGTLLDDMQFVRQRVPRDDILIAKLEDQVCQFLAELDAEMARIIAKRRREPPPSDLREKLLASAGAIK